MCLLHTTYVDWLIGWMMLIFSSFLYNLVSKSNLRCIYNDNILGVFRFAATWFQTNIRLKGDFRDGKGVSNDMRQEVNILLCVPLSYFRLYCWNWATKIQVELVPPTNLGLVSIHMRLTPWYMPIQVNQQIISRWTFTFNASSHDD